MNVLFVCLFFSRNSFIFIIFIIYLFLAVLGLRFCARAFSSCGKWGPLFIAVRGPLTVAASLVAEHRLQMRRLSSCGSRAQLLRGMWDLPRPGLKPVFPALAGRFSTTAPPGKPKMEFLATEKGGPLSTVIWIRRTSIHLLHWPLGRKWKRSVLLVNSKILNGLPIEGLGSFQPDFTLEAQLHLALSFWPRRCNYGSSFHPVFLKG